MLKSIRTWATIALLATPTVARAQAIYDVNFNGGIIDLIGTIQVASFGLFSSSAFDANVIAYSLTASNNGANPFTFTESNSTWGSAPYPAYVSLTATAGVLTLTAPNGGNFESTNGLLLSDAPQPDGARPNLRFYSFYLGYRPTGLRNPVVFENTHGPTFTLGIARVVVPEPSTVVLLGAGLFGLLVVRRRRA